MGFLWLAVCYGITALYNKRIHTWKQQMLWCNGRLATSKIYSLVKSSMQIYRELVPQLFLIARVTQIFAAIYISGGFERPASSAMAEPLNCIKNNCKLLLFVSQKRIPKNAVKKSCNWNSYNYSWLANNSIPHSWLA